MPVTDYEVTYILRPASRRPRSTSASNAIAEELKARGGEIVGELEKIGKRRLAYEIDDVREGYYVVMHFKADPDQAKETERRLRLNDAVLRQLVIRKDD